MRRIIPIAFSAAMLVVYGCGQLRPGVRSYDIEYSESSTIDKDHKLIFSDVLEDSRCPDGVQCPAPGVAVVAFEAVQDFRDTVRFNLTFNTDAATDTVVFDEYRIQLMEVMPVPEVSSAPDPEDYEVRVLVEKLP